MILVVGGAGSGKSAWAESLLLSAAPPGARKLYIATMEPSGAEARARIGRHRRMRGGKGFETVERYVDLGSLEVPDGCAVLLECLGNLCANELYGLQGAGDDTEEAVVRGVEHLMGRASALVIVSNEVGAGGTAYQGDTLRYLRTMGRIHQRLAAMADGVCEVACGAAVWYRGGPPWGSSGRS